MIRFHKLAVSRRMMIRCAAVLWTLCVLHSSAPAARAEKMIFATDDTSTFWWPSNFTDVNITESSSDVSNNAVNVPPVAETNSAAATPDQTIDVVAAPPADTNSLAKYRTRLADVRNFVNTRAFDQAEPALVALLGDSVPEEIRRTALLNLGAVVQAENDLPRAQTIFSQFLDKWPADRRVPEVLLRQGDIFREMGLNSLAQAKFYSVMTAALSLKNDQFAYYQRLVLKAQVEIAETHYLSGEFAEAVDFYTRLLQHIDNSIDRSQIQFRLIRSLNAIGRNEEAFGQAQDFLAHFSDASEEPEVRYYLAQSLKAAGQGGESLRQVLLFLREQKDKTKDHPELWAYWQQRVGNEIGNQLYKEGDYVNALQVYLDLAQLDPAPAWRLPVDYQVGVTYERLLQPQKAIETYNEILAHESALATNSTPGLKTVFEMSRWRVGFLEWQKNAQADVHAFASAPIDGALSATNP
jgi:tetratricopeptide (TPR) repeat protein